MFVMRVYVGMSCYEGDIICPKCGRSSGDNWTQCGGACPLSCSPHYRGELATQYFNLEMGDINVGTDH